MSTSKLLAVAVLVIAIGAAVAGFTKSTEMPQQTTVIEILDHTSQTGGQSELASITRADEWLNSPPLTPSALRGKVVLIDFWTYTCINWLRTAPYVRAWADKYKDQGLVVIGVHAPEFPFEKSIDNVRRAVKGMQINYPVAVDNEHRIWRAFDNSYWPALYFIDAQGRVRHYHFGEGSYEESEKFIQELLAEAGAADVDRKPTSVHARGLEAAADWSSLQSGENYVRYEQHPELCVARRVGPE
jgi:thiol-disulfide isomerase/thioredoxin